MSQSAKVLNKIQIVSKVLESDLQSTVVRLECYKIFINFLSHSKIFRRFPKFFRAFSNTYDDIERVPERVLSILFPTLNYNASLGRCGLSTLHERRAVLCDRLFNTISSPSHKLNRLLPAKHSAAYNTRHQRVYNLPHMRTDRFRSSFIPAMCIHADKGV